MSCKLLTGLLRPSKRGLAHEEVCNGTSEVTIGLDLPDRRSYFKVFDEGGVGGRREDSNEVESLTKEIWFDVAGSDCLGSGNTVRLGQW